MMKKSKNRSGHMAMTFLCFCMLLIPALSCAEEKAVTVMIYMTGSDLESGHGAATADILEMMNSGFHSDQVNVIVFTGGSTKWYNGLSTDSCGIYIVEPQKGLVRLCDSGLMNMGSPETLTYFLDWCVENCPSKRYDLILWDHGGGPFFGICADRLFEGDTLTLSELSKALSDSPFHETRQIELVGCDACLMGSLEVATVFSSYAKYMVVSEEVEPAEGWNYSYLNNIEQDTSGAHTGKRIVDDYFTTNQKAVDQKAHISMACLDLSEIPAVNAKINSLFNNLSATLNNDTFSEISRIRENCAGIGRMTGMEYDLVDLQDLLNHLESSSGSDAEAALDALSRTIIYHRSSLEKNGGLSVYFPYYNKSAYVLSWNRVYEGIEPASAYGNFIHRFGEYHTHPSFGHWNDLVTRADGIEEGVHSFSMQLTAEQVQHYSTSSLIILEKVPDYNLYSRIYEVFDVHLDENGVLHAEYDDAAFYPVNDEGNFLSGPIPFTRVEDDIYLIRCALERGSDLEEMEAATMYCTFDQETDSFRINGIYSIGDQGMITVQALQDWRYVILLHDVSTLQQDADGQYLSWKQSKGGNVYGYELKASDLAGFVLKQGVPSASRKLAFFQVSDTQNYTYGSKPAEMKHTGLEKVSMPVQTLLDNDDYRIQLSGVDVAPSDVTKPGVILSFETDRKNRNDKTHLSIQHIVINGIVIPELDYYQLITEKDVSSHSEITLAFNTLRRYGINHIQQIDIDINADSGWTGGTQYAFLTAQLDLDLSEYYSPNMEEKPIAVSQRDGITFELQKIYFNEEELSLQCLMKMKNESDRTVNLSEASLDFSVNGCQFANVMKWEYGLLYDFLPDIYCPPGAETSFIMVIEGHTSWSDNCDNYYQLFGISQIEQLGFNYHFWEEKNPDIRMVFHLPDPLSVPTTEHDSMPVLLDCLGLSVYLERMEPYKNSDTEQGIKLMLVVENHSDGQCETLDLGDIGGLTDYRVRLNGKKGSYCSLVASYDPMPRGTSTRKSALIRAHVPGGDDYSVLPLESVSFPFSIQLNGQTIRTTPVQITFTPPIIDFDQSIYMENVEIVPAQLLNVPTFD